MADIEDLVNQHGETKPANADGKRLNRYGVPVERHLFLTDDHPLLRTNIPFHNKKADLQDSALLSYAKDLHASVKAGKVTSLSEYDKVLRQLAKQHHKLYSKEELIGAFQDLGYPLPSYMVKKQMRSQSGVLVITVVTSPHPNGQQFTCPNNCHYCPNEVYKDNPERDQPRSYLSDEPAVRRANQNRFDPIQQFMARVNMYIEMGHPIDKVELIVLGGTWSFYPKSYREEFIQLLFYAANTVYDYNYRPRPPYSLEEEQRINETARVRIIGLTLETRPDWITKTEIVHFRKLGCTRVQLGVQHTDMEVLNAMNRKCPISKVIKAIRLLKDACYKVDIHLMPDLPFSTPELDKAMFDEVLQNSDLQADQWKIYPCQVMPFTMIEKWYKEGKYKPFTPEQLMDVLCYVKPKVHPWIRLNRVIRDFTAESIIAGNMDPGLRDKLKVEMQRRNLKCRCIRCREVKPGDKNTPILTHREYQASDGTEHFISFENEDRSVIYGFLRLRLTDQFTFKELEGCALIRELHVYGVMTPVSESKSASSTSTSASTATSASASASKKPPSKSTNSSVQHTGLGSQLLKEAERIAIKAGFKKIAVIAGVGTRDYYRKFGYKLNGHELTKEQYQQKLRIEHQQKIRVTPFLPWPEPQVRTLQSTNQSTVAKSSQPLTSSQLNYMYKFALSASR